MKLPEMPPLPETHIMLLSDLQSGSEPGFNEHHMRSFALQYAESVREACAQKIESLGELEGSATVFEFAAAIRRKEE